MPGETTNAADLDSDNKRDSRTQRHSNRSDTVTDLNNERIGGVPALFKSFTQQAGLDYDVSLETRDPAKPIDVMGRDPRSLIDSECSAYELGMSSAEVKSLQQIAFDQLGGAVTAGRCQ